MRRGRFLLIALIRRHVSSIVEGNWLRHDALERVRDVHAVDLAVSGEDAT